MGDKIDDGRIACNRCNDIFSTNIDLESHLITCVRPTAGVSFSHMWKYGPSANGGPLAFTFTNDEGTTEKNLPLSQELAPLTQPSSGGTVTVEAHECDLCNRKFPKARGLSVHKRSCKKNTDSTLGSQVLSGSAENQEMNDAVENLGNQIINDAEGNVGNVPAVNIGERSKKIWGKHSIENLSKIIDAAYEEIVYWRKNIFKLPSGAAGKDFIREMTRIIELWTNLDGKLHGIALKLLMLMPAILLQKPTRKSTSKLHTAYLTKRLEMWSAGNFEDLMKEGRLIQHKFGDIVRSDETIEHIAKVFARLMLQGKVNAALRLLNKQEALGIAKLDENTIKKLKELHPVSQPTTDEILISGELPYFDPVIFTNIDEKAIATAAMRTRGAAGPSGLDAEGWRRILISKNYGLIGKDLRTAIAKMTQVMCSRELNQENENNSLEAYVACRLIPLEKKPSGIRPIGIGEVLRRIVGKAVIAEIKPDLMESAGSLQLCAGQKAGCEAAAHAMREIYNEEETDGVLLIDASNAFNCLNRKALLHNVQYICPQLSTYVRNCYKVPSRLFEAGGVEISSAEGTTQGDPSAMPSYAVGIMPFLALIKPEIDPQLMKQVAYADDLAGGSKLERLREWWDKTVKFGPAFGYYPKASKSWLVVKESEFNRAIEIFDKTNINITTEGQKYLGGFLGTDEAVQDYVEELVNDWVAQLDILSSIAKSEPQAAYTGFTSGFKHKMTYYIRTIPNIADKLKTLDDKVQNDFIPAITEGHRCNHAERSLLSLPVRLGGMGIPIFAEICQIEFNNSVRATKQLTHNINRQIQEYEIDRVIEKEVEQAIKKERKERQEKLLVEIRSSMTKEELRANDNAQQKGASAWLNALPLEAEDYALNKREFFDAIQLRYRWSMKRLPINCVCKKEQFSTDHAMQCINGGFVHKRHDRIRDALAKLLDDVAYDVRIEPPLEPLTGEGLPDTSNKKDEARLDIAARGFWQEGAMAFFDVRVFNPFAKTHSKKTLEAIFDFHEDEKKTKYNQRVIDVEHGSFTPIVLSAYGGFGRETERFISNLITKISEKRMFQ